MVEPSAGWLAGTAQAAGEPGRVCGTGRFLNRVVPSLAVSLATMTPSELARYAIHLRSTVEHFGVLADRQVTPRSGSTADQELSEARTLSLADGIWGEGRVRTAYQAALMSYTAALDEGLAAAAVLTGGVRTAIPAVVLSRSIAEVCSQAWWLLESGVGARGRVERLQCLRLRSAIEGERAAEADGIDRADWPRYTETQAQVREYSRKLGLAEPRRDGYVHVCGSQRMPSVSRMVPAMLSEVGVEGAYNIHSGFAHGEIFALWQGFGHSDDGRLIRPVVNERTLQGAVAVAARALYCAAARLSDLFGLDRPPGRDDWINEHDAVTNHLASNRSEAE